MTETARTVNEGLSAAEAGATRTKKADVVFGIIMGAASIFGIWGAVSLLISLLTL
ncbi:MAG: hypothetical protein AB1634_16460 [Thermodesulfobacteriota bacterium]